MKVRSFSLFVLAAALCASATAAFAETNWSPAERAGLVKEMTAVVAVSYDGQTATGVCFGDRLVTAPWSGPVIAAVNAGKPNDLVVTGWWITGEGRLRKMTDGACVVDPEGKKDLYLSSGIATIRLRDDDKTGDCDRLGFARHASTSPLIADDVVVVSAGTPGVPLLVPVAGLYAGLALKDGKEYGVASAAISSPNGAVVLRLVEDKWAFTGMVTKVVRPIQRRSDDSVVWTEVIDDASTVYDASTVAFVPAVTVKQ